MAGIKPPSPATIWRFSSAHFYRKVISETKNLWYNILEVIRIGKYHRESAEHKSHAGQSDLYLKNKSNLFLWQVQSGLARTEVERRQATYEQIKAYVLEQTGLKVSSLYIAQIKKKCGLDVGENFNLPKSENVRQPKCTPEKEDAIMQAFRHFGII